MNYRMNNLDDLIINQGYMSQRTKSPRRINNNINMPSNLFHQNNEFYPNINKINNIRDMSPNKMVAKGKPLLNPNIPNNRMPLVNNNFNTHLNYQTQVPSSNPQRFNLEMKGQYIQPNTEWKNIKSPRSPQMENQNFNQVNQARTCFNHTGKRAEYMAQTDGEIIYYCETCAAKLAAQQFEVIKLPNSTRDIYGKNHYNQPPRAKLQRKQRQIPCITEFQGNEVYQSVIEFLKEIYSVQEYHYETHQQLQTIDKHYDNQIEMVDEFYNQLMEILQKMHQDHVTDLRAEKKKHSQMKDIYQNEIYENLQTIEQIIDDLDQNFQTVVNKITNEEFQFFKEALVKNRSNIRFFCNQIEQQRDMFNQVTSYQEERLNQMVTEYENCLVQLWVEPKNYQTQKINLPQMNNPIQPKSQSNFYRQPANLPPLPNNNNVLQPNNRSENVKNEAEQKLNVYQIHQNPQKTGLVRDFEGKGACRQIFEDDEEQNLNQQVSPKFKNI